MPGCPRSRRAQWPNRRTERRNTHSHAATPTSPVSIAVPSHSSSTMKAFASSESVMRVAYPWPSTGCASTTLRPGPNDAPRLLPTWSLLPSQTGEQPPVETLVAQMRSHNVRALRLFVEEQRVFAVAEPDSNAARAVDAHARERLLQGTRSHFGEVAPVSAT